jgi:hypothetical protein
MPGSDAAAPLARIPSTVPVTSAMTSDATNAAPRTDGSVERQSRAARADRLATQLDALCEHAERALRESVAARDAQQIAWLVVCDRGWPRTMLRADIDLTLTDAWLAAWSAHVALPVRLLAPRDLVEQRRIRRRLDECETALRSALPAEVWRVVDPLDDTGRSTLAYVLQAIVVWANTCARCNECGRAREQLSLQYTPFVHQAYALGYAPPSALLDLDGWRRVMAMARGDAAAGAVRGVV